MVIRSAVRLTVAYIVDWLAIIVVGVAGGVLNYVPGYHRPFSLTDIDIAYPNKDNIVSVPVLILVSLVAPAVIITAMNLASQILGQSSMRRKWAQTRWEINVGLLGLCAGLAATLFLTSGLKDMIGKPRPNALARCDADLSKITGFTVGGFGDSIDSEAAVLVTSGICRQADKRELDDSFAAFPSGHSSFSCAGLVYLSLWLCARFSLAIPYLDHQREDDAGNHPTRGGSAPPLWQLAAALSPIVVALFISSSRYADFHHAGFDIVCGSLLGTAIAVASFRLFHLPMRRSRGVLAWSRRPSSETFFSSAYKFDSEGTPEVGAARAATDEEAGRGLEMRNTAARWGVESANDPSVMLP